MGKKRSLVSSRAKETKEAIPTVTVLAIGVWDYQNIPKLRGPKKDIERLRFLLNEPKYAIYGQRDLIFLENPTGEDIRKRLVDFVHSKSAKGDQLLLYFSGHGCIVDGGTYAICPKDAYTTPDNVILISSVVTIREIVQAISAADSYATLILDSCFSGAAVSSFSGQIGGTLYSDIYNHSGTSFSLFTSSSKDKASWGNSNGGFFSQAVFKTLEEGLAGSLGVHQEFLTTLDISGPVKKSMEIDGHSSPRIYIDEEGPSIPLTKNLKYKPTKFSIDKKLCELLKFMWNTGNPREIVAEDVDRNWGKGAYANYRKLAYPIWGLISGKHGSANRLTQNGIAFVRDDAEIPKTILRDPARDVWVADPKAKMVKIDDF